MYDLDLLNIKFFPNCRKKKKNQWNPGSWKQQETSDTDFRESGNHHQVLMTEVCFSIIQVLSHYDTATQ